MKFMIRFARCWIREYRICKMGHESKSDGRLFCNNKDQGRVLHDYVLGLYDFLERLVQRYPNLLIEGCSGGGGRFDAGMMYYTPQIWCSDNTDAIDRLRIQYGTSFGYPVSVVGSCISSAESSDGKKDSTSYKRCCCDVRNFWIRAESYETF